VTPPVITSLDQLTALRREWRDLELGLVATMGDLHRGHLALIEAIARRCDRVVVSIFVNPTQFGPDEDYERYPRRRADDLAKLAGLPCDAVWLPEVATMYPLADSFMVRVPEALANGLCGRFRPGHFHGVASVVLRLFEQVRPNRAIFGEKDYQQLVIIRRMVSDFSLSVAIESLPTVREADGLAMSSRNRYLDPDQRAVAGRLYEELTGLACGLGEPGSWPVLRQAAWQRLERAGFEPEYLEWLDAEDLDTARPGRRQRLFAAARLGPARLIDNVQID